MRKNLTNTIEDYLKTIYDLSIYGERVTTNQLAQALEITPASVTGMIKKLSKADPPLVDYQKHRGVLLTDQGERIALEVLRHHRLIELFLNRILGYKWDEVHEEAERLEHHISEEFEQRIANVMGNPTIDPHGDPIPSSDLRVPENLYPPLSELRPNQEAIVRRVVNSDPEFLRYLSDLGVVPQSKITVSDYSHFDNNLHISIQDHEEEIVLGERITSQVFVEILPEKV